MTIIFSETPLRQRAEHDLYPTQPQLVDAALNLLHADLDPQHILDPGCGLGAWGSVAAKRWPQAVLVGVDVQFPPGFQCSCYESLHQHDFLTCDCLPANFNLVVGNPPFKYAEEFIRKAYSLLVPGGYMLFLLRLSFLASKKRAHGLWREIRPNRIYVLATRPSFTADNRCDDSEYALYIWHKWPRRLRDTPIYWYDWKEGVIL